MGKWLFSKNHIRIHKWLWNVHPTLLRLEDYIGWSQCSTCNFSGKNKIKKVEKKKRNGTLNRTRYIHQSLSKYKLSYSISRPFDHTAAAKRRYIVTMWPIIFMKFQGFFKLATPLRDKRSFASPFILKTVFAQFSVDSDWWYFHQTFLAKRR